MSKDDQPSAVNIYAKARSVRRTVEHDLLELANCVSDTPIYTLTQNAAFEPLVTLLFSQPFHDRNRSGDTRCNHLTIVRKLIQFGQIAHKPLLDYLGWLSYGYVQKEVLYLLTKQGGAEIFDGLAGLYKSPNTDSVAALYSEALIQLDKHKAASIFAEVAFNAINTSRRVAATLALGDCFPDDVIMILIATIEDEDVEVAISALNALKKIKSPQAIPFLVDAATNYRAIPRRFRFTSTNNSIAQHAIDTLAAYDSQETRDIVFEWCINHIDVSDVGFVDWAVTYLLQLGEDRTIPYLVEVIENTAVKTTFSWAMTRRAARQGLSEMKSPLARAALRKLDRTTS